MLFFIGRFIIVWTLWYILADKKRWREIFPVSIFAGLLGSTTDNLTMHYKLWEYHSSNGLHPWILKVMDDWGIYMVVVYLFIQWLPENQTWGKMFGYWFIWTGLAITIEWIHVITNHMDHHLWWTYGHSYIADWVLFWLFYEFHKKFRLKSLSNDGVSSRAK